MKRAFKNVDVEYCDYNEINDKVSSFIEKEEYLNYDRIFITDISVNDKVAILIDSNINIKHKLHLVDHHGTALWLAERYNWAHVRTEESNLFPSLEPLEGSSRDKVMASGTSLLYKFLRNKHIPNIEPNPKLKSFVEVVRRFDTWEWHNIYKSEHPKRLNDLLYLIGRENFVERFYNNPMPTFDDSEEKLLGVEQYRINKYIWRMKQNVKFAPLLVDGKEYKVAWLFAEQYGSLLGNAIAEEHGDSIDFVALIDMSCNKVSLRGIHDHINLGKDIARHFGGGGHPRASGFEITNKLAIELFLKSFNQLQGENK